jgi:outer membrane protein
MQKMGMAALAALGAWLGIAAPATAGNYTGDTLVRVQGTVVIPDSSAKVESPPGSPLVGASADVSTEVIPTLTITHFFTKNIAAELFCCFGRFNAEGRGTAIDGANLGSFWVFPPILTLQYHFDPVGGIKPYVGAGVEYMAFFNGGHSDLPGNPKIKLDPAWGFALQGGVDVELGKGWYLNADIKKVWLETDASWDSAATAKVTVDPLIVSAGLGYRFNLSDLLGGRPAPAPLK